MMGNTKYITDLRERFRQGLVPLKGTSNDYFYYAALECVDQGLSREEAFQKILLIYKDWEKSDTFSKRPWSNIEVKIMGVYS